jgi:hypothetical protein
LILLFLGYTSLIEQEKEPAMNIVFVPSEEEGFAGDSFSVDVFINADAPINVVESSLSFPNDLLEAIEINKNDSIIDLWAIEPLPTDATGTIPFSGGILQQGGFVKKGKVFTVNFVAKKEGDAVIRSKKSSFALADGLGTIIVPNTNEISYTVKQKPAQNPDINKNGTINFVDAGLWMTNIFKPYETKNDMNGDGAINFRDLYFFW